MACPRKVHRISVLIVLCLIILMSVWFQKGFNTVKHGDNIHHSKNKIQFHDITEDEPEYLNTKRELKPWQAVALLEWDTSHAATNGIKCNQMKEVGNKVLCMDEPYTIKPPCLVYSFGIDYRWSFDDAMGKLGCEVHSFDPSMVKVQDHKRSEHVTFHRIGLTGDDIGDIHPPSIGGLKHKVNQTWELRKLTSIKKMLGHENRPIDVLKLDIESFEWEALKNFYKENVLDEVTQFMMEWHVFPKFPPKKDLPKIYRIYEHLEEIGFRSFYKKYDTVENKNDLSLFHTQSDTYWVNTKKSGKTMS